MVRITQLPYKVGRPRVLVVENDLEWRQIQKDNLEKWKYQVILALGEKEALIQDAIDKAHSFRCHLALVDIRLFDDHDEGDRSGLTLVPELKPTRAIMVTSSESWRSARQAILEVDALDYIQKTEGRELIRKTIDDAAVKKCACRHRSYSYINWRGITPATFFRSWFPDGTHIPDDEADDILIQLFPEAERLSIKILREDRSNLTSVPRPRSLILHVEVNNLQPVIVKLARRDKIQREIDNFRLYVEGQLGGNFHPSMENSIVLWDMGGAAYKYVGQFNKAHLLSEFYMPSNRKQILSCLDEFFTVTWSPHYQPNKIKENEGETLFDIYCQVWERQWYDQLCNHLHSGKIDHVLSSNPKWLAFGAPDPVRWLTKRVEANRAGYFPNIQLAVTHGDLHADNLLVDVEHNIPWVIDFERTGYGHVLQDFAELETDIVNRLVSFTAQEYSLFYQLCTFVAQPSKLSKIQRGKVDDPRLSLAFDVISHLRELAHQQTGIISSEEYLWGLLFNTLFRAKLLLDQGEEGHDLYRTLMLASILCHRLDEIDRQESLRRAEWPPPNWPVARWLRSLTRQKKKYANINQYLNDLQKILIRFQAFNSDIHLRAVLVVDALAALREEAPYDETPIGRITWIIQNLLTKAPDGTLLILFLQELVISCDKDSEPHQELERFLLQFKG